jgi:hypothetical protein
MPRGTSPQRRSWSRTRFRFPIVAFELVLVGPDNSLPVTFSAGDGVFFYKTANGQLCLEGGLPEQCILALGSPAANTTTGETSNAVYGDVVRDRVVGGPWTFGETCCASYLVQSVTIP